MNDGYIQYYNMEKYFFKIELEYPGVLFISLLFLVIVTLVHRSKLRASFKMRILDVLKGLRLRLITGLWLLLFRIAGPLDLAVAAQQTGRVLVAGISNIEADILVGWDVGAEKAMTSVGTRGETLVFVKVQIWKTKYKIALLLT